MATATMPKPEHRASAEIADVDELYEAAKCESERVGDAALTSYTNAAHAAARRYVSGRKQNEKISTNIPSFLKIWLDSGAPSES